MIHALGRALVLVLVISVSPLPESAAAVRLTAPGPCALELPTSGCRTCQLSDHPSFQGEKCHFSQGQSNFVDDADDQEVTTIPLRVALSGIAEHWLVAAGSVLTRPPVTAETLRFGAIFRTLCRFRC